MFQILAKYSFTVCNVFLIKYDLKKTIKRDIFTLPNTYLSCLVPTLTVTTPRNSTSGGHEHHSQYTDLKKNNHVISLYYVKMKAEVKTSSVIHRQVS